MKKNTFAAFFLTIFYCSLLTAQTFTAVGDSISDDNQYNYYPLTVPSLAPANLTAAHGLQQVCLDITHTYDGDLEAYLISPTGRAVRLFSGIGGGGDNFTNTCFTATSLLNIGASAPPFSATYTANLGVFNDGSNGLGLWQLRILDTYPQDKGILNTWSISFDNNVSAPLPISSDLPLITINTVDFAQIPDEPKVPAIMRIYNNTSGALNTDADTPEYEGNIGIEIRGNYSASLPQKPYGFETYDAALEQLDTALLGMPKEHDWALLANYNDKVMMRNDLAYLLSRKMGHYAPRTKHCEVYLNGEYQGVYLFSETIKRGKQRVDIAKMTDTTAAPSTISGGYIIKNDIYDGTNGWATAFSPLDVPSLTPHLIYHYPKPDNITTLQKNYLFDFVNTFETQLYSANFSNPTTGYRKYIDTRSFYDYFIMQELTRNNDGFKKSCYFYKDKASKNDKLFAGPVWDFDWAWKNIDECPAWSVTDGSGWSYKVNECGPDAPSVAWTVRLLQDTTYANELHCRWRELRQTVLSQDSLFAYIDAKAAYLNAAQARHHTYWGNMGSNTGAPEVTTQPATYAGHVAQLRAWIVQRMAWLDANMVGRCTMVSTENQADWAKIDGFAVFPNPTKSSFNLVLNENYMHKISKNAILDIYNMLGQKVFSTTVLAQEGAQTIQLPALAAGVYTLVLPLDSIVLKTRLEVL